MNNKLWELDLEIRPNIYLSDVPFEKSVAKVWQGETKTKQNKTENISGVKNIQICQMRACWQTVFKQLI